MSVYDDVAAYHRKHGDDYGSEEARLKKYEVICDLIGDRDVSTVLDVGCGEQEFRGWVPAIAGFDYTGIDLLNGQNVLDYTTQHDVVVANGIFYKLKALSEVQRLIEHMWTLARQALIFTSLSDWAPDVIPGGELALDPCDTLGFCSVLTPKLVLRHDYLPGDFVIAMYR